MHTLEKIYLSNIHPIDVGNVLTQANGIAWLTTAVASIYPPKSRKAAFASALYRRLLAQGTIMSRQSCITDYASLESETWCLFSETSDEPWWNPSLERRMKIFHDISLAAALTAFPEGEAAPDTIIQVSCTGYESPTAIQRLIVARSWGESTRTMQLGHMGCYAAVPACNLAATLAASVLPKLSAVSVLHIELCTLHLAPDATEADQVVVQFLFADGAVRYDLGTTLPPTSSFALLDTFERLLPGCEDAMTWTLTGTGFRMTLAQDVPHLVVTQLPNIVASFLSQHNLQRNDVRRWAIHPGGAKIIDGIAACLDLSDESLLAHSRHILRTRGNMSSATLPHIWHAMLNDPDVKVGEIILSLAFGPGLTITGNLLRKEA